jgi:hypothetical protein
MSTANPFGPRRPRPARRNALVLALLATVSLSACGGEDEDGDQPAAAPETSTPSPSPATDDQQTSPADGTPIRITFGDTELTARLDDNATARDLAAQLPLTLSFRDHNNVEKTAPLPRELSLEGAPEGHDPAAGDIGYGDDQGRGRDGGIPRYLGVAGGSALPSAALSTLASFAAARTGALLSP